MKFTKENLRERIATDLGGSRKLSDRSINEMIDTMIQFAGEDTELDAFFAQVKPAFVTANGNLIKEQSDFVKDWNEKHPDKKIEVPANPPTPPTGGLSAEDVAAIVAKSLQPIAEIIGGIKAEKTTETLFAQAKEKFLTESKPDQDNQRVATILDRVYRTTKASVTDKSEVCALVASMKGEFDELVGLAGIDKPYVPVNAGGGSAADDDYKEANQILQDAGLLPKV